MALMIFTVTPDDGEEFEVEAGSRDLAAWERRGTSKQPRTLTSIQQNPSIAEVELICWLAMERLERAGKLTLPPGVDDIVSFRERCDVVSRPGEGLENMAGAPGAAGGGAYPPVR